MLIIHDSKNLRQTVSINEITLFLTYFVRTTSNCKLQNEICTSLILIDTIHYTYKRAKGTSIFINELNCSCNMAIFGYVIELIKKHDKVTVFNSRMLLRNCYIKGGGGVKYKNYCFYQTNKTETSDTAICKI